MKQEKYCVIDLSGIFRGHWHATEMQPRNEAMSRTLEDIRRSVSGFDDSNVAICCDTRAHTFRHELSEAYKAHRGEAPLGMYELLEDTERRLARDYHVFRADGFEADDVCATLATFLVDALPSVHVTLASNDKDLAQCVNDCVTWVRPRNGEELGIEEVIERYGVHPHKMPHWQAIVGDTADGIRGVKGVGPKAAVALLAKWPSIGALATAVFGDYLTVEAEVGAKKAQAIREAVGSGSLHHDLKLATMRVDALPPDVCRRLIGDVPKAPPRATQILPPSSRRARQPQQQRDVFDDLFGV